MVDPSCIVVKFNMRRPQDTYSGNAANANNIQGKFEDSFCTQVHGKFASCFNYYFVLWEPTGSMRANFISGGFSDSERGKYKPMSWGP